MTKAAIIGNTSWGTTLGHVLAGKGCVVHVWARSEAEAAQSNLKPNGDPTLAFTGCPEEAVEHADLVILAVPAQSMRQNIRVFQNILDPTTIVVSAAKGLEAATGKRMTEVLMEELDPALWKRICVLSGPNLAREVAQGLSAATVVACRDPRVAAAAKELVTAPEFHVLTSADVAGVEFCGAMKNIIALGAGIVDGMALGDNAKGAYIALGWAEMISVGVAAGAEPATFWGLAGLGDLFTTCASNLSRNHTVGFELGRGRPLQEVLTETPNVAEGVDTTAGLCHLAKQMKVEVPITQLIHRVLFESLPPPQAVSEFKRLLSRLPVTVPTRHR